jgi:hypothetical protein
MDAASNKTFAFTAEEKDALKIRGFVPAGESKTLDQQITLALEGLSRLTDDLAKYEVSWAGTPTIAGPVWYGCSTSCPMWYG